MLCTYKFLWVPPCNYRSLQVPVCPWGVPVTLWVPIGPGVAMGGEGHVHPGLEASMGLCMSL